MMNEVGLATDGPNAVPALFDAARAGDPHARDVVNHAGAALGQAVASLVNLTGVRCFVLAGGISAALPQLKPSIVRALQRFSVSTEVTLKAGILGADAGVIGAALLGARP